MATIKSYTTIEQSRKLAEILPLESADMYYFLDPTPVGNIYIPSLMIIEKHLKSRMPEYDKGDIPCWSLAALLDVLPKGTILLKSTNISSIDDIKYHCECHKINIDKWFDNPVDACYEMITKLKEQKLL